MSRINTMPQEKANPEVKEIYNDLKAKIGRVPNIFQNMGNSPAVLKGFLNLSEATNETSLSPQLREQIALIVAQTNNCHYCLSAHTTIAKSLGVSDADIMQARHGSTSNAKNQSILKFAKIVVENRGKLTNQDIASLKAAGVNDQELVEIILVILVNMFTNYFNNITDPKIDFPIAPELT